MPKHFSIIGIVFLSILFVSCAKGIDTSQKPQDIATSTFLSKSPSPNLTWSPLPSKKPTNTPTPNAQTATEQVFNATFNAHFATSKANNVATHTAAYATLESRKAVCSEGYDFNPFFPEDIVKRLDAFQTDTDRWTVIVCLPLKEKMGLGYTQIINHNGSIVWTISYDNFKLPEHYHYLGASSVDRKHNSLYLRPSLTNWSGWSPSMLFGMGDTIYRINLDTGELTTILPEIENGYYFDSSISPNYQYLVFSDSRQANLIHILNPLDGKTIKTIALDENYVITGDFTWTSSGTKLIFVAGINGWEQEKAGISIFRLDMNTLNLQTLLLNDKRNLVPWPNSNSYELWLGNNILNLASIKVSENDFSANEWAINIETGQLIQIATPTPKP